VGPRARALLIAAVVAVLVAVVALAGLGSWQPTAAVPALQVVDASGAVEVASGNAARAATPGEGLRAGDAVRTTEATAWAVLRAGTGSEIRLEGGTDLRVLAATDEGVELELDGGRVRAEVGGDRPLTIRSGDRSIQATDAAFTVGVDGATAAVEVTRGDVALAGFGAIGALTAGERAVALGDGGAVLAPIPDAVVLSVDWPEGRRTRAASAPVVGRAPPGARVTLRAPEGPPLVVQADAEGRFEATIPLREGEQPVVVEAVDALGAVLTERVVIERDSTPPTIRGGAGSPR
jgi:hypothetical protein